VRLVAVVAAVLLALVASVLVAPGAQALSDTGDGGVFVPTTGRILETMSTAGYNSPMAAGEWRTVKVTGRAGVPADGSAGAVSVIATVAEMPGQGQLVGRPNAQTPNTLMMIYGGGGLGTTSNSAILALNSDGTIQVHTETKARLFLDVQGYYTSNKDGTTAGGLVTVPGARIADTRSGLGVAKAQLKSGDTTTVQVTGTAGVPKGASAVVVNLTAINTSTVNGFLTPYAAGTTRPKTSLNYGSGNVLTSITAQVPLSDDGKMTVYNQSSTVDLVVDVQGYFTAAGNTGAMFTPGTGRLYDTRTGSNTIIGNGETRSIQIAGGHTPVVGSGITAVVITLTALHAANNSGGATVWAEGAARPGTTSIQFTPNSIRSNTITVPVSASGKINLSNVGDPTHYVLDVQGWYANPRAPMVSCGYKDGSQTAAIPDNPFDCTIVAPQATSSGQKVVTLADNTVSSTPLSATAFTSTSVKIAATGGMHSIVAQIRDADDEIEAEVSYSFRLGGAWHQEEMVPAPALNEIAPANTTLIVQPRNDVFPEDVLLKYTIWAETTDSQPVAESAWLTSSYTPSAGLFAAGRTYLWSVQIQGTPVGSSSPMTVSSPMWAFSTDESVVVTVLGEVTTAKDATVLASDLTALGVSESTLAEAQIATQGDSISYDPSLPSSSPADTEGPIVMSAATGGYDVMGQWRSKDGKTVYLRRAPLEKIRGKHNLDTLVVKRVTQSATSILGAGSGTNYNYFLGAADIRCYVWGCQIKQATTVIALVDYRRIGTKGESYGVVTTYCDGFVRCPNYVKNALNK
jgi:hypothetical protein